MTGLPTPQQWPADLSPDGYYTWDGTAWQPNAISPDRRYFAYRGAWYPLPPPGPLEEISRRPLKDLVGAAVVWREADRGHTSLWSGSELFATLDGQHGALLTGPGEHVAVAADGSWTFSEPSQMHPGQVIVVDKATGTEVAQFDTRQASSFEFTSPGGWTVTLRRKGVMEDWEWININQDQLVYLGRFAMPNWSTPAMEREVRIQPVAAEMPDLSLLLLLGHFLSRTVEKHR